MNAADGRDKRRSRGRGFNRVLQAAGADLASRSHTHALTRTSSGQGQPADTGPGGTKALKSRQVSHTTWS